MRENWKLFVSGKEVDKVKPLIHRSWQRSKASNVYFEHVEKNEILPAIRLKERRQAQEELLYAG